MKPSDPQEASLNKASGGDGMLGELFKFQIMMLTQYVSKFGKFSNCHRLGKNQLKCVKIINKTKDWARLQQYVNQELPDVQAGFRKGGGTRDQIANIR